MERLFDFSLLAIGTKRANGHVAGSCRAEFCKKAELGNAGLVDLVVTIGCYQLLGSFCTVLRIKVDEGVAHVPFND